jgi:hypothetical protein
VSQYVEKGGDRVTLVPRLIGYTEKGPRPGKTTESQLFEMIREKNKSRPEVAERMIDLYEWMKAQRARPVWGKGAVIRSVSLWLGEDADADKSNPVMIWISPRDISISFIRLVDKRSESELKRLAELARQVPGVAPSLQDLEARDYRSGPVMKPEEVLGSDEALEAWKRMLMEATRAA